MKQDIFQKIENASSPDFGDLLTRSFDLFKKVWLESFLHTLILMIAVIPFIIIIYLPFVPIIIKSLQKSSTGYYNPSFDYPVLIIVGYFTLLIILIIIMQAVSIAITAHFFQVCKKEDTGSSVETGSYFKFFTGTNFSKVFLLSLATFGISIIALLMCYFPIFYVMVPLNLLIVIFAFNENLSVSDIINLSFKLGNKFWLFVFGLILISSLIAQLGIIFCFVGLLFTAFFAYIPLYYFYKDTIGFDDVPGDDQEHISDQYTN